jgi:hypothetical protein
MSKPNNTRGMMETAKDPHRLEMWPYLSTITWPKKLERVAPNPKQDAVSPTVH